MSAGTEEIRNKVAKKAVDLFLVNLRVKKYKTIADITPDRANGRRAAKVVWPKINKEPA
jgi:hypothetical protein